VVLKSGFASSITTVVDLETPDGVTIRSFPGSAQICHVDFPGYNGTSLWKSGVEYGPVQPFQTYWHQSENRRVSPQVAWYRFATMIPTEYRCRQSSSTSELHCGLCLHDQQKVGII